MTGIHWSSREYSPFGLTQAKVNALDHKYRIEISEDKMTGKVTFGKTFDEVTWQGEIEGLSFDGDNNRFLLLYNRGAHIVLTMPKGFYDGYNEKP